MIQLAPVCRPSSVFDWGTYEWWFANKSESCDFVLHTTLWTYYLAIVFRLQIDFPTPVWLYSILTIPIGRQITLILFMRKTHSCHVKFPHYRSSLLYGEIPPQKFDSDHAQCIYIARILNSSWVYYNINRRRSIYLPINQSINQSMTRQHISANAPKEQFALYTWVL